MLNFKNKVVIIVGPTASGKSALALLLAEKLNGAIINADSSQVYKEAPILTSSPSTADKNQIPHYLYNFLNLDYSFKVTEWLKLANTTINQVTSKNKTPILVGGNGFYINTLINGLSNIPEPSNLNKLKAENTFNALGLEKFNQLLLQLDHSFTTKFHDPYRLKRAYSVFLETGIPFSVWQKEPRVNFLKQEYILFKIIPNRIILYSKINERFKVMLKQGAIPEVETIINSNINPNNYKKIIGVQELVNYLSHNLTLEAATEVASQKTRNYAKRQITWFKNQLKNAIIFTEDNVNIIFQQIMD